MRAKSTIRLAGVPFSPRSTAIPTPTFPFRSLLHLSLSLCTATSSATRRQGGGKCSCRAGCRSRGSRSATKTRLHCVRCASPYPVASRSGQAWLGARAAGRAPSVRPSLPAVSTAFARAIHGYLPSSLQGARGLMPAAVNAMQQFELGPAASASSSSRTPRRRRPSL